MQVMQPQFTGRLLLRQGRWRQMTRVCRRTRLGILLGPQAPVILRSGQTARVRLVIPATTSVQPTYNHKTQHSQALASGRRIEMDEASFRLAEL